MNIESALECVRLSPPFVTRTLGILTAAAKEDMGRFFQPHPFTHDYLQSLAVRPGRDLYYVLTDHDAVLGYGLLRGWNDGYEVPSLGIMIDPTVRRRGLGRLLMTFLHASALGRGASRVRLRVHADNARAIALYRSMRYEFAPEPDSHGLMVGIKDIVKGIV